MIWPWGRRLRRPTGLTQRWWRGRWGRDFDATLVTRTMSLDLQPLDRADAQVARGDSQRRRLNARHGGWKFAKASITDPAAANQALLHELASGATAVTLVWIRR